MMLDMELGMTVGGVDVTVLPLPLDGSCKEDMRRGARVSEGLGD